MSFKQQISEVLKLEHPIKSFIEQSNGWYVIQQSDNQTSTRYNGVLRKRGFGYVFIIHDFKNDLNYTLTLQNPPKDLKVCKQKENKPFQIPL